MNIRRVSCVVAAFVAPAAVWFCYQAQAAETPRAKNAQDATGPSKSADTGAKLSVAKIDGSRAFSGFKKGDEMRQRFTVLQKESAAARQAGDKTKADAINEQLGQMSGDVRRLMMDALSEVATEKKIDVVLGMRADQRGKVDLEVVYRSPDLPDVPDITEEVVTRVNKLADSRPSFDLQPASAPAATRPSTVTLQTRPSLRLQPSTPRN